MLKNLSLLAYVALAVPFLAFAQNQTPPADDHPHHHGPPPEAFTACATASVGSACTVKHHDHEMKGTCESTPDNRIACRPSGPPPGPPPGEQKLQGDSSTR